MGKSGPETKLVTKMRDAGLAEYGDRLLIVKNHGNEYSATGVSDLTGCLDGVFFACEVKAPETYGGNVQRALDKGPTVKQRLFVAKVLAAGGVGGFAATIEQFMEILDCAAERDGGYGGCGRTCDGHYV
jgi:hypothetical protein